MVQACREHGIAMYCLSGMRCSLHARAKECFIKKHYGTDIELVTAKSQEMKLEVLDMFTKIHKCTTSEILYIDDFDTNIINAAELGYAAYNVRQLSELIDNLKM